VEDYIRLTWLLVDAEILLACNCLTGLRDYHPSDNVLFLAETFHETLEILCAETPTDLVSQQLIGEFCSRGRVAWKLSRTTTVTHSSLTQANMDDIQCFIGTGLAHG
jgi:hypothetical protein